MQIIKKRLLAISSRPLAFELLKLFEGLFETQCLTSAGLTIGAAATVTLGNAITAQVNGVTVTKAATSAITLNGPTIPNSGASSQVWVFAIDAAGTLLCYPGNPGVGLANVTWPIVPEVANGAGQSGLPIAVIGSMTMTNASVGSFIPNTTLVNVANLGIVVNNTVGPFFPIQVL